MRIWLDDIRPAPEGWVWVKDATEFWRTMAQNKAHTIEAISFDNDLGETSYQEGWEIIKDLIGIFADMAPHIPKMALTCHSANVAARKLIEGYIGDYDKLMAAYRSVNVYTRWSE